MWRVVVGALVSLAVRSAVAQQTPLFRAASNFVLSGSKGDYVPAMAVADLGGAANGAPDGFFDIVALSRDQFAAVLFGRGDGTFRVGPNPQLGTIPTSMAVADFNGDQVMDLLVTDSSDSALYFRGITTGILFARPPGVMSQAGRGPVAVAAADLNDDDKMDAIVVNAPDVLASGITILIGKGDGTFTTGTLIPAGTDSSALAVADFGGEGNLDVAVTNAGSDDVTIFRGDGAGSVTLVQAVEVDREPVAIAAADLNHDGRVDLVVANHSADNISVLDGRSDGTFNAARNFPSGSSGSSPTHLAIADVNKDGELDVLVANNRSSDVSVLLGDGAGGLTMPRTFVADDEPVVIAAGDFNRDGMIDAATVTQGNATPTVSILLSRPDGSLNAVEDVITPPSPIGVTAGDANDDARSDLIVAHGGSSMGTVVVYSSEPAGGFTAPTILSMTGDLAAIGRGDLNADGHLDILLIDRASSSLVVFLGRADGSFSLPQPYTVGAGAVALTVGDWNRDGYADVAVSRQGVGGPGTIEILRANVNGTLTAAGSLPADVPIALDTGDFNEDHQLDLAVANSVSNSVSLYLGNGDATFEMPITVPSSGAPRALAVADYDRDGFDDIAVARQISSAVTILYGNGQGGFVSGPMVSPISNGTFAAVIARDMTGDRIPDLLIADQVSNSVVVAVGTGSRAGAFQRESYTVGLGPLSLVAADFDGDGRYDGGSANGFVAGGASVLTNIRATPILRGDANGDARVGAADALAFVRERADDPTGRVEDANTGAYAAGAGIDANGDGAMTVQDLGAIGHRIFAGS